MTPVMSGPRRRVYVLAEDRAADEIGLRLAVSSLKRATPSADVVVYRPQARRELREWLGRFEGVTLRDTLPAGAYSWNCKPHVLLPQLDAGFDEAIWLDADVLVARDPSFLFDGLANDVLVGTEEAPTSTDQGWRARTLGWGLPPARDEPRTLNSCVLRVTAEHRSLLTEWRALLSRPDYVDWQARPVDERPLAFKGDQDVLNALVGSTAFAGVPVRYLRGGVDVIHSGGGPGYSLALRGRGMLRRIPPFLHAIGGKPWVIFTPEYAARHAGWYTAYRRILQETSVYVTQARRFEGAVGDPAPWLRMRSPAGRVVSALGFGHFALRGLPLTIAGTLAARVGRVGRGAA
jgi:hypothetical protein